MFDWLYSHLLNYRLIAGAVAAALVVLLAESGAFDRTDLVAGDLRQKMHRSAPSGDIVLVSIDDKTQSRFDRYPIPRDALAKGIRSIAAAGARRLYIALMISAEGSATEDAALEQALAAVGDGRVAITQYSVWEGNADGGRTVTYRPLQRFADAATVVEVNLPLDDDGMTRQMPTPIAEAAAGQVPGVMNWITGVGGYDHADRRIDFGIRVKEIPVISLADLLDGTIDSAQLKDRLVILGTTSGIGVSVRKTPVDGILTFPEVIAAAVETGLAKPAARPVSQFEQSVFLAVLTLMLVPLFAALPGWFAFLLSSAILAIWPPLWQQIVEFYTLSFFAPFVAVFASFATAFLAFHQSGERVRRVLRLLVQRLDPHLAEFAAAIPDGILTFSHRGDVLASNDAAATLLGIKPKRLASANVGTLFTESEIAHLAEVFGPGGTERFEIHRRIVDGRMLDLELLITPGGDARDPIGLAIIRDISSRKERERHLETIAYRDPLTALPNRLAFEELLADAVAIALDRRRPFALLCLDLNGFKQVNDTLGHQAGDELLRIVALRFGNVCAGRGVIVRLGGDEFVVVMEPDTGEAAAIELANGLAASLASPIALDGGRLARVGTAIGIACFGRDADDAAGLVEAADMAMYRAKSPSKSGGPAWQLAGAAEANAVAT